MRILATATTTEFKPEPARSFFAPLWQRWLRKRQRDRARSLSQVRFRLTREGVHYVGILLFIFLGAILRDINLLILLAGSMIGLLLLQWRFNSQTLIGLTAVRELPRNTGVARETTVTLRLANPKQWLGSWLVLFEDPIEKQLPYPQKLSDKGTAVVDEVRPAGVSSTSYSLTFHQRGRYKIGPSMLSTRFPLGLGRGSRILDNATELTVLPKLGKLHPRAERLFRQEMQGNARSAAKAGLHEAEFYGLRPWATGDSRRWIHWRTSARLGKLSVRQFDSLQRRQLSVLLDLHCADTRRGSRIDETCEKAISFLGTLATSTALHGGDRLAVAVAANETFSMPSVQSAVLVENLLERLSIISANSTPNLLDALQGIAIPLLSNANLLVISTRPNQVEMLRGAGKEESMRRLLAKLQINWLDVSAGDAEEYISWT